MDIMTAISDDSIDLILCDLPYGVTQNKKDITIDLEKLWLHYRRIIKERGTIVLTSQFPFTLDLINSNRKWFKYDLIWNKVLITGFLNSNRRPLRSHEHILVFYDKLGTYNPQKTKGLPTHTRGKNKTNRNYGSFESVEADKSGDKYPTSILKFRKPHPSVARHPTEKPVELFEWLVKTYSNEGDLVLDNCIGSGTTAQACINTGRDFIGIELDEETYRTSIQRIIIEGEEE